MYSPDRTSSDDAPLLEQLETDQRMHLDMNEKHIKRRVFWDRLSILKPSFLRQNASSDDAQRPHPTAWLDGLRGVAAFLVYIYHFQHMFHQSFNLGYGSNEGDNDHWLIQLPIIRLTVNGQVLLSLRSEHASDGRKQGTR
ncbi:hypothetical protein PMIN03_001066 [Paraphaeosphaeria minitans]